MYHGAKHPAEFPVLRGIPATEHALLLHEGRSSIQHWVRLLANQPGAIEQEQPTNGGRHARSRRLDLSGSRLEPGEGGDRVRESREPSQIVL